ncbi:MAG: electron transfer flavoprotein subunit beta/FixA family protein [Magnetococcus sp. DMHC-8]
MNVLVAIKPVIDPARPVRFFATDSQADAPASSTGFDDASDPTMLNPFDEIALEAAIRLQESGMVTRVLVVTVGPAAWEETLRTALAMGADRALRVEAPAHLQPLSVARCLAAVAREEQVDLLLTGRQAVDSDHNQTGQMTAALLGWGQITQATQLTIQSGEALVTRAVANGLEQWAVRLPAVITVDWHLNAIPATGGPRYASLPNILKARRKPLERLSPDRWALAWTPHQHTLALQPPAARPPGQRLQTVQALQTALHQAGWSPPA